jgi:hypothetical protein
VHTIMTIDQMLAICKKSFRGQFSGEEEPPKDPVLQEFLSIRASTPERCVGSFASRKEGEPLELDILNYLSRNQARSQSPQKGRDRKNMENPCVRSKSKCRVDKRLFEYFQRFITTPKSPINIAELQNSLEVSAISPHGCRKSAQVISQLNKSVILGPSRDFSPKNLKKTTFHRWNNKVHLPKGQGQVPLQNRAQ